MSDIRVLHFIPRFDSDSPSARFVGEMLQGGVSSCSFCVLTLSQSEPPAKWQGVKTYRMKRLCLNFKAHRQFRNILEETRADIVHIHGIWDSASWTIYRWALKEKRAVVVSPYKGTMPWNLSPLSIRFVRYLFVQRRMLHRASAIHALTQQEMKNLMARRLFPFSHTPLNDRVEAIEFSVNDAEGNADTRTVLFKMEHLYRRVVDSNVFRLMDDDTHRMEDNLVALGATLYSGVNENQIFLPIDEMREQLQQFEAESWRRLQLHASDQDVLPYVIKAYDFLGGTEKYVEIEQIARYCRPKEKAYLEASQPQIHKGRMQQVAEDYEQNETERRLCILLLNTKHLFDCGKLSRRNLADLYLFLRYEKYDDFVLENMLDDLGIKDFTARILAVLQCSLHLEAGFTPLDTIEDNKTKRIMRKLYNSDTQ